MSKILSNVAPAGAVENQMSNNNNAVTYTDASGRALDLQPGEVIEEDAPKVMVAAKYDPEGNLIESKFASVTFAPETEKPLPESYRPAWPWVDKIPGELKFYSKVRQWKTDDKTHGNQTYYTFDIIYSDGSGTAKFNKASSEIVKAWFGKSKMQPGATVTVTDSESSLWRRMRKLRHQCFEGLEVLSKVCATTKVTLSFVTAKRESIDLDRLFDNYAFIKLLPFEEAKAKARKAKEESKLDSTLSQLTGEHKKAAASVASMNELQLAMTAAVAAGNMEELMRLTKLQMELQKTA